MYTKTKLLTLVLFSAVVTSHVYAQKNIKMSTNKETVSRYMDGFNASDHSKILSCLTDDIIWEMPGVYHHNGKAAFDKEIENEAFTGKPVIKITRLTEEANVVVAEGSVKGKRKDGGLLDAVFCDVFEMKEGKISKLTSYIMSRTPNH